MTISSISTSANRPTRFNRSWHLLTLAILSFSATPAAMANYFCTGTVDHVAVRPDGIVYVDSVQAGLSYSMLCQIGTTFNGVNSDTCKAILSVLQTASVTGQQVLWAFQDTLSCTTHTAWGTLTGWYYGPDLVG